MKTRKWILVRNFDGFPKDSDLELQEEELPELKENEILIEALYLSVDPYMRCDSHTVPPGSTMIGEQLARVKKSRNDSFPEGMHVLARVGWRERTIVCPKKLVLYPAWDKDDLGTVEIYPAWNTGKLVPSLSLSVVGMPGLTAYFGLMKICDPKPGETVFVNSAAGIVGSTAGQIAKIKGCRVIGSAGTDDKCKMLTDYFGFDYAFNYKTKDLKEALTEGAPNGIDCYFDNVGGDMSIEVILNHMNRFGRVTICGILSAYNATEPQIGPHIFWPILFKELKVEGYMDSRYADEMPSGSAQLLEWVEQGKLKYKEELVEGFDNMRSAFFDLLRGKYGGKVLVKP